MLARNLDTYANPDLTDEKKLTQIIDDLTNSMHLTLTEELKVSIALVSNPHCTQQHLELLTRSLPIELPAYSKPTDELPNLLQQWVTAIARHPKVSVACLYNLVLHWGIPSGIIMEWPAHWGPAIPAIANRIHRSGTPTYDEHVISFCEWLITTEHDPHIHHALAALMDSDWNNSLWLAYTTAKAVNSSSPKILSPDPYWHTCIK